MRFRVTDKNDTVGALTSMVDEAITFATVASLEGGGRRVYDGRRLVCVAIRGRLFPPDQNGAIERADLLAREAARRRAEPVPGRAP